MKEMEEQDGIQPNVVTYSTLISACAVAIAQGMQELDGRPDDRSVQAPFQYALTLFQEMKETNVKPNIVTYNVIIKACAEIFEPQKAFQYMDELIAEGLQPTIVTFGTLMMACERVGDMAYAGKVFSKMKAAAPDVEPNEIVYGAAISCCRKANHPERALLLLRKMMEDPNLHPNTAVYNTVIMALTADLEPGAEMIKPDDSERIDKNLDRALKLYRIMSSTSSPTNLFSSSSRPNRQTYSILLRATTLAKPPKSEMAEQLLRQMKHAGFAPTVDQYAAVVTAYERGIPAKPLMALRIMEEMSAEGFDFYENQVLNSSVKKIVKLVNHAMTGST